MWDMARYSDDELRAIIDEAKSERRQRAGISRVCVHCGATFFGRSDAKFCSGACRTASHRAGISVPSQIANLDRWVRHSGKRPIQPNGKSARVDDPSTWSSLAAAKASKHGDGLGFVFNGDGVGGYDFDHCVVDGVVDPAVLAFIDRLDAFYVEFSPSGTGVHAWVYAESQPGWRKTIDGLKVEFYTQGRYFTVTGNRLRD